MSHCTHLLATTDFSSASEDAIQVAAKLARKIGAKMTLLHVHDPAPLGPLQAHLGRPSAVANEEIRARDLAKERLQAVCRELIFEQVDVEVAVLEAPNAALAACDYARDHTVDMVVVGTHGRARLTRWLIGGVAEQIVRHAPCSVLAVRGQPDRPATLPKSILVGTDFSPAAGPALDVAGELASELEASIILTYCYDPSVAVLPAAGGPEQLGSAAALTRGEMDLKVALAKLARSKFGDSERVSSELLVSHSPAESMCTLADERDVELIVVGAQGRTGRSRISVGAVAEKVLRHAPCSVLTVRPSPRSS